jgi:hypothetical protein
MEHAEEDHKEEIVVGCLGFDEGARMRMEERVVGLEFELRKVRASGERESEIASGRQDHRLLGQRIGRIWSGGFGWSDWSDDGVDAE